MQLQFPFFPSEVKLISECVGVYKKDDLVQYLINGLPAYAHAQDNILAFRYFTSNLIHQGLCRKVDIQRCFGVSEDSVHRYYNKFVKQGEAGFFGDDARKGKAYKIRGALRMRIQAKLDKGQSVNSIAKEENVRESAIRYHIEKGNLKKKPTPQ